MCEIMSLNEQFLSMGYLVGICPNLETILLRRPGQSCFDISSLEVWITWSYFCAHSRRIFAFYNPVEPNFVSKGQQPGDDCYPRIRFECYVQTAVQLALSGT